MMENNKAILVKANAAITIGDYEGFLNYCTEDTQWTFVGEQVLQGKAAVREWMKSSYIHPPVFDVKSLIAEDDFVTALGNITLADKDKNYTHYTYCDVWKFQKGKMVELTAFVVETKV